MITYDIPKESREVLHHLDSLVRKDLVGKVGWAVADVVRIELSKTIREEIDIGKSKVPGRKRRPPAKRGNLIQEFVNGSRKRRAKSEITYYTKKKHIKKSIRSKRAKKSSVGGVLAAGIYVTRAKKTEHDQLWYALMYMRDRVRRGPGGSTRKGEGTIRRVVGRDMQKEYVEAVEPALAKLVTKWEKS